MTIANSDFEIGIGSGSSRVHWEAMSRTIVLRDGGRQILRMSHEEAAKAVTQLTAALYLATGEGLRELEEIIRVPLVGKVP